MADLLSKLGTWNWLIIGVVLMGIETFAPGVFMLWLGLAALIVGLLSFGIAWSMAGGGSRLRRAVDRDGAVVAILLRRNAKPTDKPFLNKRAEGLVAAFSRWRSRSSMA